MKINFSFFSFYKWLISLVASTKKSKFVTWIYTFILQVSLSLKIRNAKEAMEKAWARWYWCECLCVCASAYTCPCKDQVFQNTICQLIEKRKKGRKAHSSQPCKNAQDFCKIHNKVILFILNNSALLFSLSLIKGIILKA